MSSWTRNLNTQKPRKTEEGKEESTHHTTHTLSENESFTIGIGYLYDSKPIESTGNICVAKNKDLVHAENKC
jgi:hypothetical protein